MSLDAVVFKNLKTMQAEFGDGPFDVELQTGDIEPSAGSPLKLPLGATYAADKWLGNVAGIGELRELVEEIFQDRKSVVLERVIYSGSHSGDVLEISYLAQLRAELDILRRNDAGIIQRFVSDMDELVAAAEREGNPIVFV